jgi:hypothetical protein
MNQSAQTTSSIIASSRTGLIEAVLWAVYTLSREVSRAVQLQPAPGLASAARGCPWDWQRRLRRLELRQR